MSIRNVIASDGPVVLLVEDLPLLRDLLDQELEESCTLFVAGSVAAAIRAALG
jgi:hypothetical protein